MAKSLKNLPLQIYITFDQFGQNYIAINILNDFPNNSSVNNIVESNLSLYIM